MANLYEWPKFWYRVEGDGWFTGGYNWEEVKDEIELDNGILLDDDWRKSNEILKVAKINITIRAEKVPDRYQQIRRIGYDMNV